MSYDKLIDECLEYTPLATRATVSDRVRRAVSDLCEEADVLVREVDIVVPAGQEEVSLPSPTGLRSLRVSRFIEPELRANLDYCQLPDSTLRLFATSDEEVTYRAEVAMKPSESSSEPLPPELMRYRSAVFARAMNYLLMQFGQDYYNPSLASEFNQQWMSLLSDAKRLAIRGHHRGSRQTRFRRFI